VASVRRRAGRTPFRFPPTDGQHGNDPDIGAVRVRWTVAAARERDEILSGTFPPPGTEYNDPVTCEH
jgi:hypothetical protein